MNISKYLTCNNNTCISDGTATTCCNGPWSYRDDSLLTSSNMKTKTKTHRHKQKKGGIYLLFYYWVTLTSEQNSVLWRHAGVCCIDSCQWSDFKIKYLLQAL